MPASATVTIVRPVLGNTDTVTAAVYNASGVASATATIEGAVADDGSEPVTGDLTVNGTVTANSIEATTVTAGTINAGNLTTANLTSTGLLSTTGTLKIGSNGSVMNAFQTGAIPVTLSIALSPGGTSTVVVTIPGATTALFRNIFINGYNSGDFAVISYTVAAADQVTVTYKRVAGTAGSGTAGQILAYFQIA